MPPPAAIVQLLRERAESILADPAVRAALAGGELDEVVLGRRIVEGVFGALMDGGDTHPDELGSWYEQVLELRPVLDDATWSLDFRPAAGNDRRTGGSYYTPPALVERLLAATLDPRIEEARGSPDPEAALLGLTVCDPACGSGRFLVAAGLRLAGALVALGVDRGRAGRLVAERCLFGVDRDPVAARLCHLAVRTALGVDAGVAPGVKVGDALLGAWPEGVAGGVPDAAFRGPRAKRAASAGASEEGEGADDPAVARALRERNARERVRGDPLPPLTGEAADAWCAAFTWPALPAHRAGAPTHGAWCRGTFDRALVRELARQHGFFHWTLAFPEVFAAGGFAVVVGNPPWEQLEARPADFFAARAPEIAAARDQRARQARLGAHLRDRPAVRRAWEGEVRRARAGQHFLHACGAYPLSAQGRLNASSLFVELARRLVRPGGAVGLVVPATLASGSFTRHLFGELLARGELRALHGLDNATGIFPGVKRSTRFGLLTLDLPGKDRAPDRQAKRAASARASEAGEFVFHARTLAELDDPERRFTATAAELRALNPETGTCPAFRGRADARRVIGVHRRMPTLHQGWGFAARLLFMADEASHHLLDHPGPDTLPWLTARLVEPWDHRVAPPTHHVSAAEVDRRLGAWTRRWMVVWQDVTDTNTMGRTLKVVVVPRAGCADGLPVLLIDAAPRALAALVAILDSFVVDWVTRQKLGGVHLRFHVVRQLPVLSPAQLAAVPAFADEPLGEWLARRAVELAYTDPALAPFARDCGFSGPPFPRDEDRRFRLRCEIDAALLHAYGLDRADAEVVLDSFDVVRRREVREHGGFRSRDGILALFDEYAC